jgi:hypothetical protein
VSAVVESLEQEHGCWTKEYWLCQSEGYRVESDDGHLGYIEEVVWAPDGSYPLALRVRAVSGERDVITVTTEDVLDVCPLVERILVRAG